MSVKARRVPNVRDEIVDDWYGSIVDKEWDEKNHMKLVLLS